MNKELDIIFFSAFRFAGERNKRKCGKECHNSKEAANFLSFDVSEFLSSFDL
jgi:hypothetical protein